MKPFKPSIKVNRTTLFLIALVLACLVLPQRVQATDLDGVLPGGNNADGFRVLTHLTTGGYNTGSGWFSLFTDQAGSFNTAFGAATLFSNTGDANTAVGTAALFSNGAGAGNTANGFEALFHNTSGGNNTAIGDAALFTNTIGSFNTAVGRFALISSIGNGNTACGQGALGNATGSNNTALGNGAGGSRTTGDFNIDIGNAGVPTEGNTIRIGDLNQTKTFIAGISGVTTGGVAVPVLVDIFGQLGTISSSRRFKRDIQPMDKASEAILALKPVTFHYKTGAEGIPEFGLIAEEVAEVNPDLVVRDKNGEIYTVRYDAVNAMLLNEFLKEHRKVETLKAIVAQQQQSFQSRLAEQERQIEALASGLQKVSDHLQMSKPTPQVVANAVHETLKGPAVTDFCNPN